MADKKKLSRNQAIAKLWELGNLSYKLKGIQKEMRENIVDKPDKRSTFLISRRTGKSFVMATVATEICVSKPNSIVKYVCPKQKMVKVILLPIMRTILEDCPPHLKPEYMEADKVFRFPNGSEIQFAGSDNGNIENLRGGYANLCIVDEAAFVDDLSYAIKSVLSPTTKTVRGKIVLASTPSPDPNHAFMTEFVQQAREDGTLLKYTLRDNPMFDEEIIQEIIEEFPMGEEDPDFRREYMCEVTQDGEVMVIPEFTPELEKDIIKKVKVPSHYDAYVAGDPAATDLTVCLFSYYDYLNQQIVILDELVMGGSGSTVTTVDIADGIKRKEKLLYRDEITGVGNEVHMRFMDNNNKILLNDLHTEHGLLFMPTEKRNKEQYVNKLRLMIKQGKIIIHPRCKTLIYHLRSTKWDRIKQGRDQGKIRGFQRSRASSDGSFKAHHGDAVDALIYLIRNVDYNKDPYPDGYHITEDLSSMFFPNGMTNKNSHLEELAENLLNLVKKKK